ncbi:MAG: DUF1127 domain-containing protein [Geminicoccaceae bacterium]
MTALTLAPTFRSPARDRLAKPRGRSLVGRLVARARYRAELRRLLATADHLLADVGLSRGEAAHEAAKPLWRA